MLIQSREQFDSAVEVLGTASVVAFDTETNGKYPHKGHRLCGVSAYVKLQEPYAIGFYFPFRHSFGDNLFNTSENLPVEWLQELGRVLARPDLTTIWHGFKFDAAMLRAESIEIGGPIYDTLTMSVLVNENWDHSLDGLELRFFGSSSKKETKTRLDPYLKGKKDYSKVPPADMEPYAVNDARLTYESFLKLVDEMAAQELLALWPDEQVFLRCLFEMEWRGVLIDRPRAAELSNQAETRMRTLEDQIEFDPQKNAELARRLYLPPPEGLGLQPGRPTKNTSSDFPQGLPQMDEAALLKHGDVPLITSVLEYRGIVKLNSTFYAGFLRQADAADRIHPTYNTGGEIDKYGTRTGRLTCAQPNIQQLPRETSAGVRKLLIPPPRHRLYEFDYSQIEYRLAGVYAEEESILEAYRQGSDMHQLTYELLGLSERYWGKQFNFTVLYGGGKDRLAEVFGISVDDAETYLKEYWAKYPKLRKLTYACTRTAKERNWIRLWDGHRRHFRDEWEHHKAFNSLIQGGVAKIVQRTMCTFHSTPSLTQMVYQVHDALGFYVPNDFREERLEEIKEMMEWPTEAFGIPFPVDMKDIHPDVPDHVCSEECLTA